MTVVRQVQAACDARFRDGAIRAYTKPLRQKVLRPGASYADVSRPRPRNVGVVESHKVEDRDELEAKLGVPADGLGALVATGFEWRGVELPARRAASHAAHDFEDCMRAAVALNAYSTQLRVTNGTQLMYERLFRTTGRRPGPVNVLSRDNDEFRQLDMYQMRVYCHECARRGLGRGPPNGTGWLFDMGARIDLRVDPGDVRPGGQTHVTPFMPCIAGRVKALSLRDLTPEARARLEAEADQTIARIHDEKYEHGGSAHAFDGARFMRDNSLPVCMELRYRHHGGRVHLDLALPLRGLAEVAAFSAYWPATSESASFRLLARPLQEGENGLESIELRPPDAHGRMVAVAPAGADRPSFHLAGAHDSLPAAAPALGDLLIPLTDGQLRTLRWALSREGRGPGAPAQTAGGAGGAGDFDFVSRQLIERRFGESDLVVQLRVERVYAGVRGGILAHGMGYGKTAIMIALLHCAPPLGARSPAGGRERGAAGSGDGGAGGPVKSRRLHAGEASASQAPPAGPEEGAPQEEPLSTGATLVITPDNLFHQWISEFRKFLGPDCAGLRLLPIEDAAQLGGVSCSDVQRADVVFVASSFFLSEAYRGHFDQVVGASQGSAPAARYAAMRSYAERFSAQAAGARKRKRPDLGSSPAILEMFEWERVVFDEFHKCVGESERYSACWRALHEVRARFRWGLTGTPDLSLPLKVSEMAALLHVFVPPDNRVEAQRFLDLWVRAEDWDASSIRVHAQTITVQQTPVERALYLAQRQWVAHKSRDEIDAQLLPFCSHFSPEQLSAGASDTAGAAAVRMLQERRRDCALQQDRVSEIEESLRRSDARDPRMLRQQLQEATQTLSRMMAAASFLAQSLEYVEKLSSDGVHECAVCLSDCPSNDISITRCGHVFCTNCITEVIVATRQCPTCRADLGRQDFDPIALLSRAGSGGVDCARHGSKIARIIAELRRIHAEDEAARILIFVQWNDLLLKLEAALEHYGVPSVALRGGVAARQRTIAAFAEGTQRYVLLMAMEHDDSGLNLTCSNHVFFVHPMVAQPEVVRACERQALGRVRRRGQQRDVYLYRFVCAGTIEGERAAEHQAVLSPGP